MALFTAAEAKAFRLGGETPLATGWTDAELNDTAAMIKEDFEDICGVAFEPTETTVLLDGSSSERLVLPHTKVTAVSAISVDDTALTEAELEDVDFTSYGVVIRTTYWTTGTQNISVTYTHGWATVPKRIKKAALIVAVKELLDDDLWSRFISKSDDIGTTQIAVAGGEDRWYGIPLVDAVLARYSVKVPAVG